MADDTTHPLAAAVLQQEAGEPVAFRYELHGEGQLLLRRFFVHKTLQPFGQAGKDFSEEFETRETPLYAKPQVSPLQARVPLTEAQIEAGRRDTFSTENPFCPCDSKTMRKAVRWAERAHLIGLETGK